MVKNVKLYLEDILLSIAAIEFHLAEIIPFSKYENNLKINNAVERRISIIGEAVFKADKMDKSLAISNKEIIIGLKLSIIHDYDLDDKDAIWLICKNNMPTLKEEVTGILKILENN